MSAAPAAALTTGPVRLALVGSPNTGKTTLFNALTGSAARVGNYPGVTVERREGALVRSERDVRILDLPGTYCLDGETPDEKVVGEDAELGPDQLLHGRWALLRRGKKHLAAVTVEA